MAKRRRRWILPKSLKLRAPNFLKYLGSEDHPAMYTRHQIQIMFAGSAGLWLAILEPTVRRMKDTAGYWGEFNRLRFPTKPRKTMWKDGWG